MRLLFLKYLFFLFLFCNSWLIRAQQLPLYSDYLMNGFVINPAIAGNEGYTTISLSNRIHWIGLQESPQTYVLSAQGRFLRESYRVKNNPFTQKREVFSRSGRVGWGAYLYNDHSGLINRTGAQFTYAYHLFINNRQLSFGLALNTFQFSIAQDEMKPRDPEPLFLDATYANRVLVPDANVGTYLLSANSFVGFSISNLFESRIKIGSDTYDYRIFRHYYLMGGQRFNDEEIFSCEPSFLLKGTERMVFQADLQIREYYKHDYYMGLVFRTGSAIGLQFGLRWDRLYISYAYDYTLSSIQVHTMGSQELNLAIKFGDNARRYKWLIRY